MPKALFRVSCLAICLSLSPLAGWADETAEADSPNVKVEAASDAVISQTAQVMGYVRTALDLLESGSREVLAGEGDRKTAIARREAAGWMSSLVSQIRDVTGGIEKADLEFLAARETYYAELANAEAELKKAEQQIETRFIRLEAQGAPKAVLEGKPKLAAAREALQQAVRAAERYRTVLVEIELSEGEYDPALFDLINARMAALQAENGMVLMADTSDMGSAMRFSGRVPTVFDARQIRVILDQLFLPAAGDDPVPEIPAPVFIAITLD